MQRLSRHYRAWIVGGAAAAAAIAAPTALADKKDDAYFDPEALERGAKALREINKSPYGKQVISPRMLLGLSARVQQLQV